MRILPRLLRPNTEAGRRNAPAMAKRVFKSTSCFIGRGRGALGYEAAYIVRKGVVPSILTDALEISKILGDSVAPTACLVIWSR